MTRVLVTGATGFVGRHVLEPLADLGFEVHGVSTSDAHVDGARWHRADLLDPVSRRSVVSTVKPTHLVHLAWCTGHGTFWTDPANLDWAAATLDLVAAFRECGGQRLVVTGTCAEYDWTAAHVGPIHETSTPRRPGTLYGQAKLSTQERLATYAGETGLSWAWAVFFYLFGPFEQPGRLIPYIINTVLDQRPVQLRAASQVRDFLPVSEAGRALATVLASDVEGRVNVASGQGLVLADLARRVANLLGRPDLVETDRLSRPDDAPLKLIADVARLREDVGYTPEHDVEAGLEATVTWWVNGRAPS